MGAINELSEYDPADPVKSLDDYQRIATGTAIYPGQGTYIGLMYVALKGAGEAGEFAEHTGKALRDDAYGPGQELTPERRAALIKEAGDDLWYVAAKCNELGITLSECANINLAKLYDRKARGTLQGSGDNR